jgi:hypothetical protein
MEIPRSSEALSSNTRVFINSGLSLDGNRIVLPEELLA